MRIWLSLILLYSSVVISSATYLNGEIGLRKLAMNNTTDSTTRIQSQHTGIKANLNLLPDVATRPSASLFSPMLETTRVDFMAECISHNGYEKKTRRNWKYFFHKAECDPSISRRAMKITCHARYTYYSNPVLHRVPDKTFSYLCPEHTICQPTNFMNPSGQFPIEEIACVDESEVSIEYVSSDPNVADPSGQDIHCALTLALPGTQYSVRPGVSSIDLVLTEEVITPDGSPYRASKLFIRDTTDTIEFNRAFRTDASVASAQVTLTSLHGKLQTRTFEFCMQLSSEIIGGSVIFMHSWYQVASRRGRMEGESRINHDNSTTH